MKKRKVEILIKSQYPKTRIIMWSYDKFRKWDWARITGRCHVKKANLRKKTHIANLIGRYFGEYPTRK